MPKLTGVKKINVAVFISGNGSNLKNLITYSLKKNSKFKISLVITNNRNAKGLEYAKKFRISKKVISYHITRNAEKNILSQLKKIK
jgi:phosphoribosylglycinamide formyltransferase-1